MRAISKNTRKATAITLAAALVIAVYLNWQYARTGVTLEEDAVLSLIHIWMWAKDPAQKRTELLSGAEG